MSESNPAGPRCSCGHGSFDEVPLIEFNMTWICCAKCGVTIAYRDHILLDKLDEIFEAIRTRS